MVVIPKTVTPSRITENFKATEVELDAEDMKRLRELESNQFRLITVRFFVIAKYRTLAKNVPLAVHITLDLDWGVGRYSRYHCRS